MAKRHAAAGGSHLHCVVLGGEIRGKQPRVRGAGRVGRDARCLPRAGGKCSRDDGVDRPACYCRGDRAGLVRRAVRPAGPWTWILLSAPLPSQQQRKARHLIVRVVNVSAGRTGVTQHSTGHRECCRAGFRGRMTWHGSDRIGSDQPHPPRARTHARAAPWACVDGIFLSRAHLPAESLTRGPEESETTAACMRAKTGARTAGAHARIVNERTIDRVNPIHPTAHDAREAIVHAHRTLGRSCCHILYLPPAWLLG